MIEFVLKVVICDVFDFLKFGIIFKDIILVMFDL